MGCILVVLGAMSICSGANSLDDCSRLTTRTCLDVPTTPCPPISAMATVLGGGMRESRCAGAATYVVQYASLLPMRVCLNLMTFGKLSQSSVNIAKCGGRQFFCSCLQRQDILHCS